MPENDLYAIRQKLKQMQDELLKSSMSEPKQQYSSFDVPAARSIAADGELLALIKDVKSQMTRIDIILEEILKRIK